MPEIDKVVLATLNDQFQIVKTNSSNLKVKPVRTGCVELDIKGDFSSSRPVFAVATITHDSISEQDVRDNVHVYAYRDNVIEFRTGDSNGKPASRGFTVAIYGVVGP